MPINLIAEVYWTRMPPVDLPADIVTRYNSSVMVITGHEVNVVRRGANKSDTDVPCYESYNHHFTGSIASKHGKKKYGHNLC